MNRYFSILVMCLLPVILVGQTTDKKKDTTTSIRLGLNIGPDFSKLITAPKNESNIMFPTDKVNSGFSTGLLLSSNFNRLFIRLASNFDIINYRINYTKNTLNPNWGSIDTADYTIHSSSIDISFVPGYFLGHKKRLFVLTGLFAKFPVNKYITGQISRYYFNPIYQVQFTNNHINDKIFKTGGFFIGLGLAFRLKKNEFSFEIKAGHCLTEIIDSQHYAREYFIIANINYFYKILN